MEWNPLNWLKPASELASSIGDAIDKNVTSDEERLILKNELVALQKDFQVKMETLRGEADKLVTERWKSDNESDSWLAKNIRPMTLVFLLLVVTLLAITDGNYKAFTIKDVWVELFTGLAVTAFGTYFLARGYEKGTRNKK